MKLLLALLITGLCYGTAIGETVSVAAESANIRSFPTLSGSRVILQVPQYYPLRILENEGKFFKVTDYRDREGWIYESLVTKAPGVVVRSGPANVRKAPGTKQPVLFKAEEGVSFLRMEEQQGWVKVRHESGSMGWISRELLWGWQSSE